MDSGVIDRLVAGGKYTGLGLVVYTAYRLLVFSCDFIAGRYDARLHRLEAREKRVDKSLEDRLRHLEEQDVQNRRRIAILEKQLRIVAGELARAEPMNPTLAGVAAALSYAFEVEPTPGDMRETLGRLP